jgi:hypothetical protein
MLMKSKVIYVVALLSVFDNFTRVLSALPLFVSAFYHMTIILIPRMIMTLYKAF